MSTNKSLAKSAGIIGFATLCSRILGFIRDIIIARFFGTGMYAQAFVVAFMIPNLLRDVIGEGATNSAIVPVLTEELTYRGKSSFVRLTQVLFNIFTIVLFFVTIVGILASPFIVRGIAPGFISHPEKLEVTVKLTKFLFPFLILVGLWALFMGVLNSLRHFASPAFGPALLNLSIICCAIWYRGDVFGLALGVIIGGLLQVSILLPALIRHKIRFRKIFGLYHPSATRIGILLIPRAAGACIYQINTIITRVLASLSYIVGDGAVAGMYFANRVWQLPLAIFAIALAQAALPTMSSHSAKNDMVALKSTVLFSLKTLFFILIPASIGLCILNLKITKFIFQGGAFTNYSSLITANALLFYSIGLVGCGGIKLLVNAFYSLQDTTTPVKVASISLIINIFLSVILMWPLKVGGLALANSIAATFNCILLYISLRSKIGPIGLSRISEFLFKISFSGALMGVYCYVLKEHLHILALIFTGILIYIIICFTLGLKELRELVRWIYTRR